VNLALVFTANNRPRYLRPVLHQWARVRGWRDWRPTVYLEPGRKAAQMADIATAAGARVRVNPRRYGVLTNPWQALNTAFTDGADFTVLAEDDVLVSTDVLEYFDWAAHSHATEHVLAACAGSFDGCPDGHEYHIERGNRFCCLVWGTWADRWTGTLRDTWDHTYSSGTPAQPQSGWDWNITLRILPGWDVLAPYASRSQHIGEHEGTHCTPAQYPGTRAANFRHDRPTAPYTVVTPR